MAELKHKILFVCVHNSARSQMAEAFLKIYGEDSFIAESAGLKPGKLNPYVVEVMQEKGIDISNNKPKGVFELLQKGSSYNAVVTVCDAASAERCPVFPGMMKREAWSFTDPSTFKGSKEEILAQTRKVRDEIEQQIIDFVKGAKEISYWTK